MIRSMILVLIAVFCTSAHLPACAQAHDSKVKKAVLVTGASSGIGLKITKKLSAKGFYVYAGARKDADLKRLDAMDNVSSVRLDVTVQEDIDAAVKFVKKQGRGLYGVVNNAGVGSISTLSKGALSDLQFTFNVNVYGPFRINSAFLPLLEQSKGRTVLIGSIAGTIASKMGIYSMSKFAVEAYTDSLAREIKGNGVSVSIVEPGSYKSNFAAAKATRALAAANNGEIELTAKERERYEKNAANNKNLKEPDAVADAVYELMTVETPKRRYMVTPSERQAQAAITAGLRRTLELNHDQAYELDRKELIGILDKLLTELKKDK